MNLCADFYWASGNEGYARKTVSISGVQYVDYLLHSTPLETKTDSEFNFEVSNITLTMRNPVNPETGNRVFNERELDSTDGAFYGVQVDLKQPDGTLIREMFIERYQNLNEKYKFVLSDKYSDINEIIPAEYITVGMFPAAIPDAVGQVVPYFTGHFLTPTGSYAGENCIKAWRVDKATNNDYLVGKEMAGGTPTKEYVYKPDGTDVTASSNIVKAGDYIYVDYNATTEDYLLVNVQYSADKTVTQMAAEVAGLFNDFTWDTTAVDDMFDDRRYNFPVLGTSRNNTVHYLIDKELKGKEIIKDWAKSFNINYYINAEKEIVWKYIDINDLDNPDKKYQQNEINWQGYRGEDTTTLKNYITPVSGYSGATGGVRSASIYVKQQSIDDYLKRSVKLEMPCIPFSRFAVQYTTAKYWAMEYKRPERRAIISMNITEGLLRNPTELIEFTHKQAIDNTSRLYKIMRMSHDPMTNRTTLEIKDITFMKDLQTSQRFLLQPNLAGGSENFIDDSVNGNPIFGGSNVTNNDSDTKFLASVAEFDGSTASLTAGSGQWYSDFQIANNTNTTLEVWVKFDVSGNTEIVCQNYVDASNWWGFRKRSTDNMRFWVYAGGSSQIALNDPNTVSTGVWYHFVVAKVGDDFGLYRDGNQIAYVNSSYTKEYVAGLFIGKTGAGASWLDGKIALLGIDYANIFNAAPVVGLTDTFDLPETYRRDTGY